MTGGIERALVAVHERYCRLAQLDAAPQTFTSPIPIEGGRSVSPAVSESLAPPSIDDLPPNAITPEGLARLEHEHEHITGVTIPELMETRDPESDSRSRLEEAKRRVAELGNTIVDAHVVTPPTGTDYVYFGSIVRVSTPDGQEEYQVVGPAEAHSSEGRLNVMSVGPRMLSPRSMRRRVSYRGSRTRASLCQTPHKPMLTRGFRAE